MLQDPRRNLYAPVLAAVLNRTLDVALSRLFRHVVALIVKLLTFTKSHTELYTASFKIQGKRYQRKSFLLNSAKQPMDLLLVQ